MNGLAPHTSAIFQAVCHLDCIRPYVLVGGTALSIQLGARLSEDLDFMSWRNASGEKREVDWPTIKKELESIGEIQHFDLLGLDHVEFVVSGVKISFYANPNYSPLKQAIPICGNLRVADKTAIGAMKMEVMMRRSKFRDYYDLYSLLQEGEDINEMIAIALRYSGHRLKTKNLLAMLTRSDRFVADSTFGTLSPKYAVKPADIEARIRTALTPRMNP